MKKINLLLLFVGLLTYTQAQVGINTAIPFSTLDVKTEPSGTIADGIIAPNLKLTELIARNALYTANQSGAFVYVTAIDATPAGKTINVTTTGYYYYDASNSVWKHFNDKLQNADNGLSLGTTANVQLGGDLTKNTTINTKGHELAIETGGTAATPIHGFKLNDGSQGLGKVLTSGGDGTATWAQPGSTSAILGVIPGTLTSPIISSTQVKIAYTGMYITLPSGYYQINYSAWIMPFDQGVTPSEVNQFCAIFLSDSNTTKSEANFSYLGTIKSTIIPKLYSGYYIEYYGSGSIAIKTNKDTTIYIWAFLSPNNFRDQTKDIRITSLNNEVGQFGPYTQLYAIPFHVD